MYIMYYTKQVQVQRYLGKVSRHPTFGAMRYEWILKVHDAVFSKNFSLTDGVELDETHIEVVSVVPSQIITSWL